MADHWGYRVPFFAAGVLLFVGGVIILVAVREDFTPPSASIGENHGLREAFGGRGLMAMLGVFFFLAFSLGFVAPIFPLFVEKIAAGSKAATVTGQLMAVTGIGAGVSSLLIGRMGDRVGHSPLLLGSVLFGGLVIIAHAAVRTVSQLFGLRGATGLAMGGTTVTINALIATSVSADTYGRAYGLSQSARALGWAIGPLVGGLLASAVGLRWPFVLTGLMLILSAGLVSAFMRPSRDAS